MAPQQMFADSLNATIITAIAEAEGVDPMDLEYSIYEYIDLDAVEALLEGARGPTLLEFSVDDHTVTAHSNGTITVDDTHFQWHDGSD